MSYKIQKRLISTDHCYVLIIVVLLPGVYRQQEQLAMSSFLFQGAYC